MKTLILFAIATVIRTCSHQKPLYFTSSIILCLNFNYSCEDSAKPPIRILSINPQYICTPYKMFSHIRRSPHSGRQDNVGKGAELSSLFLLKSIVEKHIYLSHLRIINCYTTHYEIINLFF